LKARLDLSKAPTITDQLRELRKNYLCQKYNLNHELWAKVALIIRNALMQTHWFCFCRSGMIQ